MPRKIDFIIVHCSAGPQNQTIASIQRFWRDNLKWDKPGYHYIIDKEGIVTALQPEDEISYGVAGDSPIPNPGVPLKLNAVAIHVCYIGGATPNLKDPVTGSIIYGQPIDNRTLEQKIALEKKVRELLDKYPKAMVAGHHNFQNKARKACPSFSVRQWAEDIGIPVERIYKEDPYGMSKHLESQKK